jgi:hypothetical protein
VKKLHHAYGLFAFLAITYISLIFILPPDANALERYGLTSSQVRTLGLTVAVPYTFIWFLAFFGSAKISNYAKLIRQSADGKALLRISNGLLVLAVGLPTSAILGNLLSYIGRTYPQWTPLSVITSTYIDIAIGIIAMTIIYQGSCSLASLVNRKASTQPSHIVTIALVLIGTSFIGLTLNNEARQFPTSEVPRAAYYLPDLLIVATVVAPLLYAWYKGLQAAYCIEVYRRHVKGRIYKSALGYLASGIVFIILARIALRYLVSLNTILHTWALQYLLIVLYCFLVLIGVGFWLVARGAKKLKQLEEV